MVEFGDDLAITYVMGGLAREFEDDLSSLVINWLDDAAESGMPSTRGSGTETPIRSTYPACMAVKAAAEQGAGRRGPLPARAARGAHVPGASSTAPRRS